eukprot:Hpha_TRINITY_DN16287_c2_g16::TRINITY_DN16287_c2_g16_i1::g.11731::m.11731
MWTQTALRRWWARQPVVLRVALGCCWGALMGYVFALGSIGMVVLGIITGALVHPAILRAFPKRASSPVDVELGGVMVHRPTPAAAAPRGPPAADPAEAAQRADAQTYLCQQFPHVAPSIVAEVLRNTDYQPLPAADFLRECLPPLQEDAPDTGSPPPPAAAGFRISPSPPTLPPTAAAAAGPYDGGRSSHAAAGAADARSEESPGRVKVDEELIHYLQCRHQLGGEHRVFIEDVLHSSRGDLERADRFLESLFDRDR